MPNSIALAAKYLPLLDEVYKKAARTVGLDTTNGVEFINANTAKVFKMALDGLGDYARNAGYVAGSETATWETITLDYDRGRSFQIDTMDDEESINLAFGKLASEFLRTRVTPEIDATRFAKYAIKAGTKVGADLSTSANTIAAIDTAEQVLGDAEVPDEGRILYVSETVYKLIKGGITRMLKNETTVQRAVEVFDGMEVVKVPVKRFCVNTSLTTTGIDLFDGTTSGETGGGYEFAASNSYPINFMIVHPSAVVQLVKHAPLKVISPEANQDADAWKFGYRVYHTCNVFENKTEGVYLHRAATALATKING